MIERVRDKDFALRDFLDLFHHRIISLFYRAWEKYRFPVAYERVERTPEPATEDLFTHCLYCLVGLGTGGLRGRMEFDDEAFLFYGGHFAHWPRSAVSLERMLADYFELPVEVRQFQGQWLYLSRGGPVVAAVARAGPQGLNTQLGADVVVGERVWDVEGKFRVRLGPLGYARVPPAHALGRRAAAAVPDDPHLRRAAIRFRRPTGACRATEVPWCRLGGDGPIRPGSAGIPGSAAARVDHDVSDAVFSLEG